MMKKKHSKCNYIKCILICILLVTSFQIGKIFRIERSLDIQTSSKSIQLIFEIPSIQQPSSSIIDDNNSQLNNINKNNIEYEKIIPKKHNKINKKQEINYNKKMSLNEFGNAIGVNMLYNNYTNSVSSFDKIPHNCIMEQNCHLYLSDMPYFYNKSIIIIGMIKNGMPKIVPILQQLDEISCIFKEVVYIFYESNSRDNTKDILHTWKNNWESGYNHGTSYEYCNKLRYNPLNKNNLNKKYSKKYLNIIKNHKPSMIHKIIFHDYFDVRGINRIIRFINFRNNLLNKMKSVTNTLNINFDYTMMIDLDILEFSVLPLMTDLWDTENENKNINNYDVLCGNGLHKLEIMRDTFASVFKNGSWIYTYLSAYNNNFEKELKYFPKERYYPMKSCFGGLAIYKNTSKMLNSCNYVILEDMKKEYQLAIEYNQLKGKQRAFPKEWDWYLDKTNNNELNYFLNIFFETNKKENKQRRKICEHLGFHYCLNYHDYNLAISRDAIVYYFDFETMKNNPY